jgi:hypothetical protein
MSDRDDNSQWQFEQEMEQRFEEDFKQFVASHEADYNKLQRSAESVHPVDVTRKGTENG